jgi:hypothetical protein
MWLEEYHFSNKGARLGIQFITARAPCRQGGEVSISLRSVSKLEIMGNHPNDANHTNEYEHPTSNIEHPTSK